ncbi:MAG: ORF6N domain-containing protein [Pyrinomonadaceae bacterium]
MPARKALTKRQQIAIADDFIERRIYVIRGQKVMLDSDLAGLYGVQTIVFNQAVRRNLKRFPNDFMFQLTAKESESLRAQFALSKIEDDSLRSQFVTSKKGRGGRRYAPYVFSEQGVAMLSSVLSSERAIEVNIAIMRAFVRLREMLATHKELAQKLEEMERKYDAQFQVVFRAIRELMQPPATPPRRKIGFKADGGQQG